MTERLDVVVHSLQVAQTVVVACDEMIDSVCAFCVAEMTDASVST
jgi:hypothetical protein